MNSLKQLCFLLFVLVSLSISCKKDKISPTESGNNVCDTTFIQLNSNDTILPSDYLMAYPGSWWQYSNGTIDSCTIWQSFPTHVSESVGNCLTITSDFHVFPKLTRFGMISYNRSYFNYSNFYSSYKSIVPFDVNSGLGDTLDYNKSITNGPNPANNSTHEWVYFYENQYNQLNVGSTTYNNVIIIKEEYYITGFTTPKSLMYTYYIYFAKDIGPIKFERIPELVANENKELTNYYIAPH